MTQPVDSDYAAYLTDPRRRIELGAVTNFRDLGGYPGDKGPVRWRTLFRSNSLHRLDSAGLATVADLGLRIQIDLRSKAEVAEAPSLLPGHIVTNFPLRPEFDEGPEDMEGSYRHLIDRCGDRIAAVVDKLSGAMPAVVNCAAGKDRTGIVIALTLAAVGVPDELIAADYALSEANIIASYPDDLKALAASPPELMLETLSRVRAIAGSPEGYLRAHGLTVGSLERLRSTLIERPPRGKARARGRARERGRPAVGPVERS